MCLIYYVDKFFMVIYKIYSICNTLTGKNRFRTKKKHISKCIDHIVIGSILLYDLYSLNAESTG